MRTLPDSGFHLHILFLGFLQTLIPHLTDTRTLLQRNDEPDLIAFYLTGTDLHVREQTLFPEALDSFGDLLARHLYLVAYSQAGETDQHEVFVTVRSFDRDARYLVRLTRHAVLDLICPQGSTEYRVQSTEHYV